MKGWLTVFRKELTELLAERHSRRGVVAQALISAAVLGVINPATDAAAWVKGSPTATLLFFFMPGVLAATIAADAFAGERERRTLETLLATPLTEAAILLGKAATAITFGMLVSLLAAVAAIVTVHVMMPTAPMLPPAPLLLGMVGGAFVSTLLMTSLSVVISMHMPIARSAQQIAAVSSMLLAGIVGMVWRFAGLRFTWHNILIGEGLLFAVGCFGLGIGLALFRRERFFERG